MAKDGELRLWDDAGRPIKNRGRCILGRETAIQPMKWGADGWLRTTDGQGMAQIEAAAPKLKAHPFPKPPVREDFDGAELPIDFQWLRSPWPEELFSLTARPGHLRLFGRETMGSPFCQALVARRHAPLGAPAGCCATTGAHGSSTSRNPPAWVATRHWFV